MLDAKLLCFGVFLLGVLGFCFLVWWVWEGLGFFWAISAFRKKIL